MYSKSIDSDHHSLHTFHVDALLYEDLTEKVYKALKEMILTNELPPGMKLYQEDLAARLGVSRTPLLAAFSKLEKEMLVEMIPRRGAYVRKCSTEEMYDFADIRMRLEPLGARGAALHADKEGLALLDSWFSRYEEAVGRGDQRAIKENDYHIHTSIARISGSQVLFQIISSFNIVLFSNQRGLLKDPLISLGEHKAICQAIHDRDPDRAERLMAAHLADIKEGIQRLALKPTA